MIQTDNSTIQSADRIKLPYSFDVQKMLLEIKALNLQAFEYYDVLPLRAPAHLIDPTLAFPPPAADYADGSWTDWSDSPELRNAPYLRSIVDIFKKHTTVTLVRLLRLAPGAVVKEHTDPTLGLEIERSVIRLTIPILNKEKVEFFLNGTIVPMLPGECWYLRLTDPHKINNLGDTQRINLSIDMIPNDWVRNMILQYSQE